MAVNKKILNYALPFPKYIPIHDMWIGIIGITFGKVKYIDKICSISWLPGNKNHNDINKLRKIA